jgi:pimeloyl-ACP methyl ester carboxylesterase
MRRSLVPVLLAAVLLAGCERAGLLAPEGASHALAAPERHPILFVHGWNSSGSVWNTMVANFKADGWTAAQLASWSYNTSQSNATTAQQIRTRVDSILLATGATKVDVITHSMGGLSSRYYARNLGGDAKIDAWVSLGGPNHGTHLGVRMLQHVVRGDAPRIHLSQEPERHRRDARRAAVRHLVVRVRRRHRARQQHAPGRCGQHSDRVPEPQCALLRRDHVRAGACVGASVSAV